MSKITAHDAGRMQSYRRTARLAGISWILFFSAAMLLLIISCGGEQESAEDTSSRPTIGSVQRELLVMMDNKQYARAVLDSVVAATGWRSPETEAAKAEDDRLDSASMARLEEIIAEFGWPGRTMVGDNASLAAFLILQQADFSYQEKYLPMVRAAAGRGEVSRVHLAMLQDRVLMGRGKLQKYGTQLWNDPSTGQLGLYPVEDSTIIDSLRREVGLGPLDDYLRGMGLDPDSVESRISIGQ